MRTFLFFLSAGAVLVLAYWANNEKIRTQQAAGELRDLQARIAEARETIVMLRAEWAYLNRPERLRTLVEMNYAELRLQPMQASHFVDLSDLPYPQPAAPATPAPAPQGLVDLSAMPEARQ